MNKGASIDFADENCNTALHIAALNGNCAMINLLVRRGANINAVTRKAKTPFALACQGGAAEAARILACTGCSIPIGSYRQRVSGASNTPFGEGSTEGSQNCMNDHSRVAD